MTEAVEYPVLKRRLVGLVVLVCGVMLLSLLIHTPNSEAAPGLKLDTVIVPLGGHDTALVRTEPDARADSEGVAEADSQATPEQRNGGPGWYVLIGAYTRQAGVSKSTRIIKDAGFRAEAEDLESNDQQFTRVRAGPFTSEAAAAAAAKTLTEAGLPNLLVKQQKTVTQ